MYGVLLREFPNLTAQEREAATQELAQVRAPKLAEAKVYFTRGVEHAARGEWDAALVEFLRSRAVTPTAKATYNAAVCLRKVGRFDEALDLYEVLLRDFADLPEQEKQVALQERAQLEASIGALDLHDGVAGARVTVDGRERGAYPPGGPLRVGAGSHVLRVFAEGFMPFEARVDVAGAQTVRVAVQLVALTAGGRLRVAEERGGVLAVVVDNAEVGKTPWEGLLAPGEHVVFLRGEDHLGTQPVVASVKLAQLVSLRLAAEHLDAGVRVDPTPPSARVIVDGVPVGRGTWEGRLRPGPHSIEATADGYLAFRRDVVLRAQAGEVIPATLLRDPTLLYAAVASLGLELDAAMPVGALFGGDVSSACSSPCSASVPLGLHGALHGIYQAASGFGGGVDVGYLLAYRAISRHSATLQPLQQSAANTGTAEDKLRFGGLTLGASAQYHRGERWPILLRVGVGVLLASTADDRSGSFVNSMGVPYDVSRRETPAGTYLYVAPELRVARRIGKHLELNVGAEVLLLKALSQPTWADRTPVLAGGPGAQGDGLAKFGAQSIASSLLLFIAPGLGARYDF
jgi:hypothetical protein